MTTPSHRPSAALAVVLAVLAGPAAAGYSCVDPADAEQRRWFTDTPCVAPMVNLPLPPMPLIHEMPGPRTDWLPGTPAGEGSTVVVWQRKHGGSHTHRHRPFAGAPAQRTATALQKWAPQP